MTPVPSIARRLALTLGFSAIIFWLLAVTIAGIVIRHELNETFDQTMQQSAGRLLSLASHEVEEMLTGGELEEEEARLITSLTKQGANLDYFLTDIDGRILVFSSEAKPARSEITIATGFGEYEGARAFSLRDDLTGISIVVVEKPGLRANLVRESLIGMILPLAALIPILIAIVFFTTRAAMNPVWNLSEAISKRHGQNLTPLEIGPQPKELLPITEEVENLLARLKSAMEAERHFAAESAHELRTPIAGALAQIQVLRNALVNDPNQAYALDAETALRSLSDLSEQLLQSSRLEAGFAASDVRHELGAVVDIVLREPEFATAADRIEISGDQGKLTGRIVPDAFAIVMRNLFRNAILHSEGDPIVAINCSARSIEVRNDCDPLDQATLAQLTERFVRGTQDKKGSGLGLAIAEGIIDDCGGTLTLTSPIQNDARGFSARVDFP